MQHQVDNVNHPPHYAGHHIFSRECIEYTQAMGFLDGNAFKYIFRFDKKLKPQEDLKKAIYYLKRIIQSDERPLVAENNMIVNEMRREFDVYMTQGGNGHNTPISIACARSLICLRDNWTKADIQDIIDNIEPLIAQVEVEKR